MVRQLKRGKRDTYTVGREIWRETLKNVKKKKYKLQDLEYGENTENHGK